MNILVIDVGTSSIRGVLYGEQGQELNVHQIAYQVNFLSETLAEQDPADWSGNIVEISRKTMEFCQANGLSVGGLALTSQRSSIIPVDQNGTPLRTAIMWQDKRNASIVAEFKPKESFINALTGARVNTVFSGTKMTWFRRNQLDLYQKTYKICTIADYIAWNITGQFRSDHTYGSRSLLMNIRTRQWDDRLLELFEVDREKLCELVEPGSVIGTVTESFAEKTGLPVGIPLVSGGGDQQCAALGHGVTGDGTMEITTGTGAYILGFCDTVPDNLTTNVICGAHAIPGKYVLESSMLVCAALYNWARRTLFQDCANDENPYLKVDEAVKSSPPGANGCVALPYFQGRGTPDWNAQATGAFANLSLGTTRGDMVRAILEAIVFEAKNNIDVLEAYTDAAEKIYIGGGLTKFAVFNQIQSDVYQKTLTHNMDSAEQTALGAWASAAVTLGLYPDYDEALNFTRQNSRYEAFSPDEKNNAVYEAQRSKMNELYRKLYS